MHECSQATGVETGTEERAREQKWMRGEKEEVNIEKEIMGWRRRHEQDSV